jgi:hypothetical protein
VLPRRGFRVTTDSHHAHPIARNTLNRQFTVAPTERPESDVDREYHVSQHA